jgi:hypothetical protein
VLEIKKRRSSDRRFFFVLELGTTQSNAGVETQEAASDGGHGDLTFNLEIAFQRGQQSLASVRVLFWIFSCR